MTNVLNLLFQLKILRIVTLGICRLCLTKISFAQDNYCDKYYPLIDSALVFVAASDYERALDMYEFAFTVDLPLFEDFKQTLYLNLDLQKNDVVYEKLRYITFRWGYTLTIWRRVLNKKGSYFLTTPEWTKFESNHPTYYDLYDKAVNKIDTSIRSELLGMKESDQLYRAGDSRLYLENQDAQDSLDHINVMKLKSIIAQVGKWPSIDIVGLEPFPLAIPLHLRESDVDNLEYFNGILKDAVANGLITRKLYRHFVRYKKIKDDDFCDR